VNEIHPTAILSGSVVIGVGNTIGPHVVITGPVTIGDGNWIGAGVVIGAPPEVRSFEHPRSGVGTGDLGAGVLLGDRNVIREYAQIHQGWKAPTVIGDDAFIMNQVYIAHDCRLGDDVTLASSVLLAGHVRVGSGANLGLGTAVHQGRYIGRGAMVGMSAVVTRDIPPFAKAYGSPARVASANVVGMRRRGVEEPAIDELSALYESGGDPGIEGFDGFPSLREAIREWEGRNATAPEAS
jgi:UDP-N-acetylglucosamine acyltransferase